MVKVPLLAPRSEMIQPKKVATRYQYRSSNLYCFSISTTGRWLPCGSVTHNCQIIQQKKSSSPSLKSPQAGDPAGIIKVPNFGSEIHVHPDGVVFKQLSNPGKPPNRLLYLCSQFSLQLKNLFPKKAFLEYSKAKFCRGIGLDRNTKLFLSSIKHTIPISSLPVTKWISAMPNLAGIIYHSLCQKHFCRPYNKSNYRSSCNAKFVFLIQQFYGRGLTSHLTKNSDDFQ